MGGGPTVEVLRQKLQELGLDTTGLKADLKKRLKKAKKKLEAAGSNATAREQKDDGPDSSDPNSSKPRHPYDYYMFFDVEATCEEGGGFDFPNEIIEFPVVLVESKTFEIVDEYRSYVKPVLRPTLTEFCKTLTGISQETVDASPEFVEVLNEFQEFMTKHSLFQEYTAAFVTDGPFDIRDFITKQCRLSGLKERPVYFERPWVNLRKLFKDFYKHDHNKNIEGMLEALGMTFEGRQHSGLDDARNLVRIAQRMHADGCVFKANMYWGPQMKKYYSLQQPKNHSLKRRGSHHKVRL